MPDIDLSGWEWGVSADWTLRQACEAGAKLMLSEMSKDVCFSMDFKDGEPVVEMKDLEEGITYCRQPFEELFAGWLPVLAEDDWDECYRKDVQSVLSVLNKYKEIFESGLAKMNSRKGDMT